MTANGPFLRLFPVRYLGFQTIILLASPVIRCPMALAVRVSEFQGYYAKRVNSRRAYFPGSDRKSKSAIPRKAFR